jgi:hypothetical protein
MKVAFVNQPIVEDVPGVDHRMTVVSAASKVLQMVNCAIGSK